MNTGAKPSRNSMEEWLLSDVPVSTLQSSLGRFYMGWLQFKRNRISLIGLGIIIAFILCAIFAPWIAGYDPTAQDLSQRLQSISYEHVLGTDRMGRDNFARVIYGSRITLYIVILALVLSAPVGLLIGCTAGYAGGIIDIVLMRITDIFFSFPRLILALAFVAALGAGLENAVLAISLTAWPAYARVARAETMVVRKRDFVAAVRLQGAGPIRIIARYILPLCLPSVIVRATLDMAGIILTAAGLGFLGLGAQPPVPEWGLMISEGRINILDQWWVAAVPGVAILITSLGFNLLGDGLRDVLDPRDSQ